MSMISASFKEPIIPDMVIVESTCAPHRASRAFLIFATERWVDASGTLSHAIIWLVFACTLRRPRDLGDLAFLDGTYFPERKQWTDPCSCDSKGYILKCIESSFLFRFSTAALSYLDL